MGDDTVRNFGVVIAICGALFVFGGPTFSIWTFGLEAEADGQKSSVDFKFGTDEVDIEYGGDDPPDDEAFAYDDDDCTSDDNYEPQECKELGGFFSNIKMMFYALIACGIGIAYLGNSGDVENLPSVAGLTAVLSVVIMAYTFTTLPEAFDEDTELFSELLEEDPAFFVNSEKEEDGVDLHWKAMPYVGFFLPVVSLTLGGLLVKPELMD